MEEQLYALEESEPTHFTWLVCPCKFVGEIYSYIKVQKDDSIKNLRIWQEMINGKAGLIFSSQEQYDEMRKKRLE